MDGEGHRRLPVSLVLCDDDTIHELNLRYLGHDYPTDVLSFPFGAETMQPDKNSLPSEPEWQMLGEIIISVETAERNAKRYRQTLESELLRLAIHGTLHLLGYDDGTPHQRRLMRRKERIYLKRLTNS